MGLGKKWTEEELDYLEMKWGNVSISQMSISLGRTVSAIQNKAFRIGLGGARSNSEYLIAADIAKMFGVCNDTVSGTWLKHGLKHKKVSLTEKSKSRKGTVLIKHDDLMKWLKCNTGRYDTLNLEYMALGEEPEWLKDKRKHDLNTPNRRATWSPEENSRLMYYRLNGLTYKEIAVKLNKTVNQCTWQFNKKVN